MKRPVRAGEIEVPVQRPELGPPSADRLGACWLGRDDGGRPSAASMLRGEMRARSRYTMEQQRLSATARERELASPLEIGQREVLARCGMQTGLMLNRHLKRAGIVALRRTKGCTFYDRAEVLAWIEKRRGVE